MLVDDGVIASGDTWSTGIDLAVVEQQQRQSVVGRQASRERAAENRSLVPGVKVTREAVYNMQTWHGCPYSTLERRGIYLPSAFITVVFVGPLSLSLFVVLTRGTLEIDGMLPRRFRGLCWSQRRSSLEYQIHTYSNTRYIHAREGTTLRSLASDHTSLLLFMCRQM